jgi:hypothetical protein
MFYQDLSDHDAEQLGKALRPMSLGPYWSPTTFAAWRKIPTTYVLCTKDAPATVEAAEFLIQSAQSSRPQMIDKVIRRDVGHSPFFSQPEWTAQMLRDAATIESEES